MCICYPELLSIDRELGTHLLHSVQRAALMVSVPILLPSRLDREKWGSDWRGEGRSEAERNYAVCAFCDRFQKPRVHWPVRVACAPVLAQECRVRSSRRTIMALGLKLDCAEYWSIFDGKNHFEREKCGTNSWSETDRDILARYFQFLSARNLATTL